MLLNGGEASFNEPTSNRTTISLTAAAPPLLLRPQPQPHRSFASLPQGTSMDQ